jgi:acyl carrier protein
MEDLRKAITRQLCQFAQANLVSEEVCLSEETRLAEAGVDSFALIELLLFVERTFGIAVPESHLTRENLASLASLARCIAELTGDQAIASQPPR